MSEIPAGWYPSPEAEGQLQYWDGEGWTNYRAVASDAPAAQQEQVAEVAAPVEQQVAPAATPVATPGQITADPVSHAGIAAGVAAAGAGAVAAGSQQTIVPADDAPAGKKRFSLKRGGSAAAPGAVVATSAEEADKALKRARIISFVGGIGLFILGFVIGKIL